jgi:hypothetical protein
MAFFFLFFLFFFFRIIQANSTPIFKTAEKYTFENCDGRGTASCFDVEMRQPKLNFSSHLCERDLPFYRRNFCNTLLNTSPSLTPGLSGAFHQNRIVVDMKGQKRRKDKKRKNKWRGSVYVIERIRRCAEAASTFQLSRVNFYVPDGNLDS